MRRSERVRRSLSDGVLSHGIVCCLILSVVAFSPTRSRAQDGQGAGDAGDPNCPPPAGTVVTNEDNPSVGTFVFVVGEFSERVRLSGNVSSRAAVQEDGTIQTEILSMSLTGSSPSLGQVTLSQSPTQPSRGLMRGVEPVDVDGDGVPDACASPDAFFDVFVELSFKGGQFDDVSPVRNPEPLRLQAETPVPIRHTIRFTLVQADQGTAFVDSAGETVAIVQNTVHVVDPPPPPPPPCYPPAGVDIMNSVLLHDIDIPGIGLCRANLSGPVTVRRSDPYTDATTGLQCINTEIIEMKLEGVDPACGRIVATLDPCRRSVGRICEKVRGTCFPANSWFNIFVKIELPDLGMCLYACDPARMQCMIDRIPPFRCLYNLDIGPAGAVPLYRGPCMVRCDPALHPCFQDPRPEPAAFIVKAIHQPLPPDQCRCFPEAGEDVMQTKLGHAIDIPGLSLTCSDFAGSMVVRRSDPYVNADGLCCIDTEVIRMEMTGTCQDGTTANIRLCPDRPSKGFICQKRESAPDCFPAQSCFNIFFEVEVLLPTGPVKFKNCTPAVMCCMIDAIPPIGCSYALQNAPVPLYRVGANSSSPCLQSPLPPPDATLENANHTPEGELETCCPEYGPGEDVFRSTLLHNIDIPGIGLCQANLAGPVRVRRGEPYKDPLTGLCCVDVEMAELQLRGRDPICGEICITLDPRRPSRGRICEKEPGSCFPANSCFDVFVRIELKTLGMVLVPCEPARMCCMIDAIPPIGCLYNLDIGDDDVVPLFEDPAGFGADTLAAVAGVAGGGGGGGMCVLPDNGTGTVDLPPQGCGYVSPDDVHMIIDGLPAGTTINVGVEHTKFFNVTRTRGGSLGGEVEEFESILILQMEGTGGLAGFSRILTVQVGSEVHTGPRTPGDPIQDFPNDMVRLQGEITGDPDFDLLRVTAGTGVGLPSPGHTTLTRLPDGNWQVDSFFDVTYRIDFVGAPGGPLMGMSGSTTGTIRMETGGGAGDPPGDLDPCNDNPPANPRAFILKVGSDGTTQTVHRPEPLAPHLPLGGTDDLESEGEVEICLFGLGEDGGDLRLSALLSGGVSVRRSDPEPDPLELGKSIIPTEIVALDLTGVARLLPAVEGEGLTDILIGLHPQMRSLGEVHAGPPNLADPGGGFQADSFFDVFVEVEIPSVDLGEGPQTLRTRAPVRLEASSDAFMIPPINIAHALRRSPVPLYLEGQTAAAGVIKAVIHTPRDPCDRCPEYGPGIDTMDSSLIHEIEFFGLGKVCTAPLRGRVQVERGKPFVDPAGLCCVTTRMTSLELAGDDPDCGPVKIRLCPERPSRGFICQKPDVAPECFPAQSCFDVFIEVEVMGVVLKNCKPVRMCCMISSVPPFRCVYLLDPGPEGILLFQRGECESADVKPVAQIVRAEHEPEPCPPVALRCEAIVSPDAGVPAVRLSWSADPDCGPCDRFLITRTNPDGTETTFTVPGSQTSFVDDLANLPCPPGATLSLSYCIQCISQGAESREVCCTVSVRCPDAPCEITSVTCTVGGREIVLSWTTSADGCCDGFVVTKDGKPIPGLGTIPGDQTTLTLPCMPGRYCVQCVHNGAVQPIADPDRQCCVVTPEQCACSDEKTAITNLTCTVEGDSVLVEWGVVNPECCRGFLVTLPDGTTRELKATAREIELPCVEGEICVQCIGLDGTLGPRTCCRVQCPCDIVSTRCTFDPAANVTTIEWEVSRDDCCTRFIILKDGNQIGTAPATARSFTLDGCMPGEYCVQCVRPDGTILPIDRTRNCCTLECPQCPDAITGITCTVEGDLILVQVDRVANVPLACCREIAVFVNGEERMRIPAAATFEIPCPGPGVHTVCVRCVLPDGSLGPEHCCSVVCGGCDEKCEDAGCCEPTGCNGVRVTTILPPDQFQFDVFINIQSWCGDAVIKECQASFSLMGDPDDPTNPGGEFWTLQDKCRALVNAIRNDPDCRAAGYQVRDEDCDANPPSFVLVDATCPGAKVRLGISNHPDIFGPKTPGEPIPDYEAEIIEPLCDPTPNDPPSGDEPAVDIVFRGLATGNKIVEDMETSTVAVVARGRPGQAPVRAEVITRPNMPACEIAGELASQLQAMGVPATLIAARGEAVDICEIRFLLASGAAGPAAAGEGGGAGFETTGAAGASNDDGIFVGNFGGPEDTLPPVPGGSQLPGDCNGDGRLDISDPVCLFGVLFLGTATPPCGDGLLTDPSNRALLNFNGDAAVDISDGIAGLNYLFTGGPPHVLGETCVPIQDCKDVCKEE